MLCCTHHGEVHDLYDPDSEGQVDDHGDQQQQQKEIEASLPPAVQTHRVHGITARSLQVQGLGREDELLLGDLKNRVKLVSFKEYSPFQSTGVITCKWYHFACTTKKYFVCVILQFLEVVILHEE